jgi:hypothetical protein
LGNKTTEQVANADKLTQGLRSVGNAAEEGFSKAATASNRFSISWETLVRVVETQFIVRALSALRDAFRTAVDDAIGFQRAVARIQTIAPGESFDKSRLGVRNISDSFNIPLLQAAEGVYQAVSNQVGNLGESLTFTATAAQFAKATNSSLADSIDLLSGAIKSFNLPMTLLRRSQRSSSPRSTRAESLPRSWPTHSVESDLPLRKSESASKSWAVQ